MNNTFNNTLSASVNNDIVSDNNTNNQETTMNNMNPNVNIIANNNAVPSFTIDLIGRKITFIGGTSLWKVNITGTNGITLAAYKGMDACKSILNAITHIYTSTYQHAELGLYTKKSFDELNMLGIADNVGYVRNGTYAGTDVDGLETLQKYQVGVVSWRYGRLNVVKGIVPTEFVAGEPEDYSHMRSAYNLVTALDLIYSGNHIILEPIARTTTNVNTGEITSGRTHVNMMLMTYMANLCSDQNTARANVKAAVQRKQVRTTIARAQGFQKAASASGKSYSAGVTQVDVIVDMDNFKTVRVNISELTSSMVALYKGRQLIQAVADLNNQAVLVGIRDRGMCVVVLEN